jgi:hypothetical protein
MATARPAITPADEVLDFLLSAPTPAAVLALRPSPAVQQRLQDLLERNRNDTLTDQERVELDDFLQLEHFVRRLKIRARERLAVQP